MPEADRGDRTGRYPPNRLLTAAREKRGWSQAELAQQINDSYRIWDGKAARVDQDVVGSWETGKRRPNYKNRRHLTLVFEESEEALGLSGPEGAPAPSAPSQSSALGVELDHPGPDPSEMVATYREDPAATSESLHDHLADVRGHVRRYAVIASAAALVACLWGGLALFQVGPYARQAIIITGVTPRPPSNSNSAACLKQEDAVTRKAKWTVNMEDQSPALYPCWTQILSPVNPGTTVTYLMTYVNRTKRVQYHVAVKALLPSGVLLVPNTTSIFNTSFPNGTPDSSNYITQGGIIIGSYDPGATAYVRFAAGLPGPLAVRCGWTKLSAVGEEFTVGSSSVSKSTAIAEMYRSC